MYELKKPSTRFTWN